MMQTLEFRLEQRTEQRLSLAQKQEIRQQMFLLQLDLIGRLRDERYEPKAECPDCHRKLTAGEILQGFKNDPTDFTTKCPVCATRFQPKLVSFGKYGSLNLPFFCDCQVLAQMEGMGNMTPEEINRSSPAVYRSAITQHGSLHAAFKKIDIDYPHEEISGWEKIVIPFLGRMPDTAIASAVGRSISTVRNLRVAQGIKKFSKRSCLEV